MLLKDIIEGESYWTRIGKGKAQVKVLAKVQAPTGGPRKFRTRFRCLSPSGREIERGPGALHRSRDFTGGVLPPTNIIGMYSGGPHEPSPADGPTKRTDAPQECADCPGCPDCLTGGPRPGYSPEELANQDMGPGPLRDLIQAGGLPPEAAEPGYVPPEDVQ